MRLFVAINLNKKMKDHLIGMQEELYAQGFRGNMTKQENMHLTLAFIGDSVFDLLVREMLVVEANRPANRLHNLAVERVCAAAQAQAARKLLDECFLTDEETAILKRGRNAHTNHSPKNASEQDYHYATGLEALFGYLYLAGERDRLQALFARICFLQGEHTEA